MLVSEMIAKLQKIQKRHGDMQLVVEVQQGCIEPIPSDFGVRYIPAPEDASDMDEARVKRTKFYSTRVLYCDMRNGGDVW